MFWSFIYIISTLLLMIVFLFLKKSNEKQNLLKWIVISLGLLFCYNSVEAFILNFIGIPIYLLSLSVINFIVSILLLFIIRKRKEIQMYYVLKRDVIFVALFTFIVFLLGFFRFGFPFDIRYNTCDPGTHFWTTKDFYEQSYLLDRVTDNTIVNFETRQFGSYVNLGIIFKAIVPFINEFDLWQVYILYDILMLLLSTLMFYFLIFNEKKKLPAIILFMGVLLYLFGYPLNSMIIGFFYLGHAITIITMLFLLYQMYDSEIISKRLSLIFLIITNLGLFFTYYLFVPCVFGGLFLYYFYKKIKKKEKIFTKDNILFISLVYILPCILGFLYFIVPNIGNDKQNAIYQISLEGLCYSDIVNSILLFIPIILFYVIHSFKRKSLDFEIFVYILIWLFIFLIMILLFNGMASTYYLSKPYYLLWLVTFIIMFKYLYEIYDKYKIEVNCYLLFILGCAILSISSVKSDFSILTPNYTKSNYFNVFGIYEYNINQYKTLHTLLTYEEMNELKELYNNNVRDIASNAIPEIRLWLAAYFETDKIEHPENQLYDYISMHYYFYADSFLDSNDKAAVLFYRSAILSFENFTDSYVFSNGAYDFYKTRYLDCDFKNYDSFLLIKKK
ncbi:MAG: hypothetical protein HFI87_02685 [Bacilli bacterium]|nr:hypothetical protein [Bacilli bacterium]